MADFYPEHIRPLGSLSRQPSVRICPRVLSPDFHFRRVCLQNDSQAALLHVLASGQLGGCPGRNASSLGLCVVPVSPSPNDPSCDTQGSGTRNHSNFGHSLRQVMG